jgi:hypothetical protein
MFVEQVIVGGVVSTRVTVCEQKELLLQESVACHERVALNVPPTRGFVTVLTSVMVTLVPSQTSKAEGISKLQAVAHSTVRLVPQVRTGGVVSTMVLVWLQKALLVHESVAFQVRMVTNVWPQVKLVIV